MRTIIGLCLTICLFIAISCTPDNSGDVTSADDQYLTAIFAKGGGETVDIFNGVDEVLAGKSTLHRNSSGITVNFKATDLQPGHAYTIWWVIWNKPENCGDPFECTDADFANADNVMVEVLYAGGHVVGNSGKGNFSARLNENNSDGTINPLFGLPEYGGLLDAEHAEVHVVLRSHGPMVPGIVNEQIGSYGGGCDVDLGLFSEIPDAVGECADIYASVHLSPNTPE